MPRALPPASKAGDRAPRSAERVKDFTVDDNTTDVAAGSPPSGEPSAGVPLPAELILT